MTKNKTPSEPSAQPKPFTPGFTPGMVRQHALELFRDKLQQGKKLTIEDWVFAEKDLVNMRDSGQMAV